MRRKKCQKHKHTHTHARTDNRIERRYTHTRIKIYTHTRARKKRERERLRAFWGNRPPLTGKNERGNRRHRYRRNIRGDDERANRRDQSKVPRHRHPLVWHAHLEKARLARRYRFRPEQERIEETFARVEARTQRRFRHGQER